MQKNFVVYKSSAGSGKTFTLVKEYLTLALKEEKHIRFNYKKILALTFTNKAASEMRIRIVNALIDIIHAEKNSTLENELIKNIAIHKPQLQERAKILLSEILHHYSDFAVSTIDSFSHKIVKTFAHDLKLPVNFNLETDSKEFYRKVISQLFAEIGDNQEVTSLLKEYVLTNLDNESNWDPELDIQNFADLIQKESSLQHIDALSKLSEDELNTLKTHLNAFTSQFSKTIKDIATKAVALIQKHHLKDEDFHQKARGPQTFFYKCLAGEISNDMINSYVSDALGGKWAGSKIDAVKQNTFDLISSELSSLLKQSTDILKSELPKYNLYTLLQKKLFLLQLLKKIQHIAAQIKQDEQLVFIEEFNAHIYEFIKNEPVSFIYERLGERYKNFLIDEFQDTSTLQWQNILPLIDNSLASGNYNLLVGDGKQSIYRWRNANVKQFALLPHLDRSESSQHLAETEKSFIRNYYQHHLDTNYRSFKTVVEFNNSIFEHLSKTYLVKPFTEIYEGHQQKIHNQSPGYVTVYHVKQETGEIENFHHHNTLQHIKRCLDSGYQYKDICVLTRTNVKGSSVATYLNKNNVPVISSDSLLLKNCNEINVIASFFKFLQNTNDRVNAAVILNYLSQTGVVPPEQLHLFLRELKTKTLFEILLGLNIRLHEEELNSKNLFDIAVEITEKLHLNRSATASLYIRFFMDEISKFMASENSNISDFNLWWEKRSEKSSLIISENINAVRIMTIHASKGLEFPVVIIPFCNWQLKSQEKWVNIDDENIPVKSAYLHLDKKAEEAGFHREVEEEKQEVILDNLNLMYVAFTRAVEQLHIISAVSKEHKKAGVWQQIEEYLSMQKIMTAVELGFEYGSPVKSDQHNARKNETVTLTELKLHSHLQAVKIKGSFQLGSENTGAAKEKGILMHYILSKINYTEDLENAIHAAIHEGVLNPAFAPEVKSAIFNILSLPELKPYYSKQYMYFKEREMLTTEGDVLRPDRIAVSDSETCIIDYKTGKEKNKAHIAQMLSYEKALQQMNYKNIKKIIIYMDDLKLIQLN